MRTICGEYMHSAREWTWTQTLVQSLMLFGVDEPAARRALLRTADEGWLERRQDGRRVCWRLTATGRSLTIGARERVFAFRSGRADWNKEWLFLLLMTRDERVRNLARRRLAWTGFGWLSSELAITPHVERESEAGRILEELHLVEDSVSFRATIGAIGVSKHVITQAWDLDDLAVRYRDFVALPRGQRPRSGADFFVSCTNLVHEWRRFVYLDPGLPIEFLPPKWIGLEALRVFNRYYERWQPPANTWFAELNQQLG
jgi:phenylacetic acid degradation operon negative regulatory protein